MSKVRYESGEQDGATAIAHELDTKATISTAGGKLLSIKNATAEKFAIDKDGNVITSGGGSTWVVRPSEGSTGIQAAINAAAAAGGGIVQLLAGTYTIAAAITPPSVFENVTIQGVGDETVLDCGATAMNAIFFFRKSGSGYKNLNNVSVGDTSIYTTTPTDASIFLIGERICVEGTAADGLKERIWARVKTAGNPTTGEVQLDMAVGVALTSTPYACRAFSLKSAKNLTIRNLKCAGSGSLAVCDCQGFENVVLENVLGDKQGFYIGGSIYPSYDYKLLRCRAFGDGVVNVVSMRPYMMSKVVIEECYIENQVSTAIQMTDCQDFIIKKNFIRGVSTTFGNGVGGSQHRRILVENNHFEKIYSNAVVIDGPESAIVNNIMIDVAERTVDPAILAGTNAIGLLIRGNHIRRARAGIYAAATSSLVQIVDNVIEDIYAGGTGPYALSISGSKHIVKGNTIRNIVSYGLLAYANDGIFTNNYIDTTGNAGLRVNGSRIVVSHNQIRNSTGVGLVVDNVCADCSITFNHTNGQGVTEGTGTGNDFVGNK